MTGASRAPRTVRIYFSFRSPFSWLALHRLRPRWPVFDGDCQVYPYWDPDPQIAAGLAARGGDFHYTSMSKAKHLYILQDTKRQARRLGLPMAWPVDLDPWWEPPHLAWLKARQLGAGPAFYDAVVSARWRQGRDICTRSVLADCARAARLDPDPLVGAVHDPVVRAEAVDCLATAYHDDVFGVPYFRVGPHRFWGLDRVDEFLAELGTGARSGSDPLSEVPTALPEAVGSYDTDTAGGCG